MHFVFMLWHEQGINPALSYSFSSVSVSDQKKKKVLEKQIYKEKPGCLSAEPTYGKLVIRSLSAPDWTLLLTFLGR